MAAECRKNRFHPELTLAFEYAFLKTGLGVDPTLRERSHPAVDVHHPLPGEKGRSRKVSADLFVAHSELAPDLLPYGFLAGDGERPVDAVKGHPVDKSLPVFPVPPHQRIAEGTIVKEETLGDKGLHPYRLLWERKHFGHLHLICSVPGHGYVTPVLKVVIQTYRHRPGVRGGDNYFTLIRRDGESLDSIVRMYKSELRGIRRHQASREIASCADLFIGCTRACNNDKYGR